MSVRMCCVCVCALFSLDLPFIYGVAQLTRPSVRQQTQWRSTTEVLSLRSLQFIYV